MKKLIVMMSLVLSANSFAYNEKVHEAAVGGMFAIISGTITSDLSATTKNKKAETKKEQLKQNIIDSKYEVVEYLESGVKTERLDSVIAELRDMSPELEVVSDQDVAAMMLAMTLEIE